MLVGLHFQMSSVSPIPCRRPDRNQHASHYAKSNALRRSTYAATTRTAASRLNECLCVGKPGHPAILGRLRSLVRIQPRRPTIWLGVSGEHAAVWMRRARFESLSQDQSKPLGPMATTAEFDSADGGSIPSGAAISDLNVVAMMKRSDLYVLDVGSDPMSREERR